ncbi:hypothetical protein QAD02_013345 [Eretmocerus hayati]|uniref:Uncharacterized protein n=1 Tax=Eretmocerus hayati TaxID=131215 RepID=A0ACC2P260_9HYME|nr:hypothetical protein QAD02_013345 [Eretmocerus hayati]
MAGLLEATIKYRDALMATKDETFRDFYDGESWEETMKNFEEDGIALPLKIASDFETRSAPSAHAVDVMHAVFGGVVPTVMSKVVIVLIVEEACVKVKDMNDALDKLDFDFEKSNKPLHIELEYIKANKSMKMSAFEDVSSVRYFGVMVGHLVNEDLPI